MENNNRKILFKEVSHIEYKRKRPCNGIKRVMKGEAYEPFPLNPKYPDDDVVKIGRLWNMYYTKCEAKQNMWHCGDNVWVRTVEEAMDEWNGHVMYDSEADQWYYKPWLEITFLSGDKYKSYFSSEQELEDAINYVFEEDVKQIGVDE